MSDPAEHDAEKKLTASYADSLWDFRSFPWPEGDALIAGADLEPSTLLGAYVQGVFPMVNHGELIWWSPLERGVLGPGDLKVSASLRRSMRNFSFTIDQDFKAVVDGCADPSRPGAWIDAETRAAYLSLHAAGWAHSVETRDHDGQLLGGLYGVLIGDLFCGESMFHKKRDASKAALVHLVDRLSRRSQWLIDTQWSTPHLATLGVRTISRESYLAKIAHLIGHSSDF